MESVEMESVEMGLEVMGLEVMDLEVMDLEVMGLEVFHRNQRILDNCMPVCCCQIAAQLDRACKSPGTLYTDNRMHN